MKVRIKRKNKKYQYSFYRKHQIYEVSAEYDKYYVGVRVNDGKVHHACAIKKTNCEIIES